MRLKPFSVKYGIEILSNEGYKTGVFAGSSADLNNIAISNLTGLGSLFLREDGIVLKKELSTGALTDWVELGETEAISVLESRLDNIDTIIGSLVDGNYTDGISIADDLTLLDTQVKTNYDGIVEIQNLSTVYSSTILAGNTDTVDSVDAPTYTLMKWHIEATDTSNSDLLGFAEVVALHDGTTASHNVNTILDTGLPLFSIATSINGGSMELSITSPPANNVTYDVTRIINSGLAYTENTPVITSYSDANLPIYVTDGTEAYNTDLGIMIYHKNGAWYKVSDDSLVTSAPTGFTYTFPITFTT